MKIVLFLNKDLEANIVYDLLKSDLSNHTLRIYYSDTVGKPHKKAQELLKIEFFEKYFIYNLLPKWLDGNNITIPFEFFDSTFQSIPFKKCINVNSKEFILEINNFNPDLFLSIRFGKIFKNDILKVPKLGVINLHSAILPYYRGIMGTLHAIKDKNKNIGCTLHTITDNNIDTGEIIDTTSMPVNLEKSLLWHIIQIYPDGIQLIIDNLIKLNHNKALKTYKQNLDIGNYYSVPAKEDFEKIERLGMKCFSVNDYLEVLTRFVVKNLSASQKQNLSSFIQHSVLTFS